MSYRSRRSDDRDRSHSSSHSSYKYDKYEHRHRRDDSRDRDYYHSKKSSRRDKSRSRYESKSRSPSNSSKSHSRYNRSRSKSPGYSSRYDRYDDYHSRSHRSKDYKELPDLKSRPDSIEHSQSIHNMDKYSNEKTNSTKLINETLNKTDERGPTTMLYEMNDNSQSNDDTYDEPKTILIDPNDPDAVLEEEKERIQRETLARLQKHLEKEGKAYPPPKPQASHPIFANDGSFLEMFKTMQGNMQQQNQQQTIVRPTQSKPIPTATSTPAKTIARFQPLKRRGAKILKTGIVQKQRTVEENDEPQTSDSWNAYLKEVKRYKTVTCSDDNMTRSLVK